MARIDRWFPNYGYISFMDVATIMENDSFFYEGTEKAIDGTTWDIFFCWDDYNYYYTNTDA